MLIVGTNDNNVCCTELSGDSNLNIVKSHDLECFYEKMDKTLQVSWKLLAGFFFRLIMLLSVNHYAIGQGRV